MAHTFTDKNGQLGPALAAAPRRKGAPRALALAFAFGVVAAHWLPATHAVWPWLLGGGLACAVAARLRVLGVVALGLGWGGWHAAVAAQERVDASCPEAQVIGRVATLPLRRPLAANGVETAQSFIFAPEQASCDVPGNIRLHWVGGPFVRGGERWQLQVRLKPPRGHGNAAGYDRARHFVRSRLAATGYVKFGTRLDAAPATAAIAWRERLRERLQSQRLIHGGVISALALGDAAAIPEQESERFRRTGTLHLLVISGLHVGIVTGIGFFLGRGLGLLLGLSARGAGVALALAFAASYVVLAGAGLSLLRAFAMSAASLAVFASGRSSSPATTFSYALALLLAIDPLAPLAPGFWLSFGAVAVLLGFFSPRPRPRSWVVSALVAQLVIVGAFAPASVGFTGLVHPLSLVVNMAVVPLATMLIVPLALAGTALLGFSLDGLAQWPLVGADFGIAVVVSVLAVADRVAPIFVADLGLWQAWMVAAAAACLLPLGRLAVAALAGTVLLALALGTAPDAVAEGEVRATVLDVGQGTAVIVETANHALLYDTGPAFPGSPGSGALVVLPALRGIGRGSLDVVVLSHGDNDHVGGADAVLRGVRVAAVHAGDPRRGGTEQRCSAGQRWRWDGVDFSVLSPAPEFPGAGNNASCVILVEASRGRAAREGAGVPARLLLAGDIEAAVEDGLELPPVDLLLVPHHGSRTSSSAAFVAATRARFAVVSAGFGNHFGHPHRDVVKRYRDIGAHIVSTGATGALRWSSAAPAALRPQRCRPAPYWRQADLGDRLRAQCRAWRQPDDGLRH